jgi:hypothetical protein
MLTQNSKKLCEIQRKKYSFLRRKTMKKKSITVRSHLHWIFFLIFLIPLSVYAKPFSDNGNGTITDSATGLTWQKCSMGQNSDATCTGTATTANWVTAVQYCEDLSLASRTDWRLPNTNELTSIVDKTKTNPAIDTSLFPATVAGYYWSSTAHANNPANACYVNFLNGYSYSNDRTVIFQVRCVAGP